VLNAPAKPLQESPTAEKPLQASLRGRNFLKLRKLLGFAALLWAFSAGAFQGLSCGVFLQGVSCQGFPVRTSYKGI